MGSHDDTYAYALSSNAAWASYKTHQNPTFFSRLAAGQSPRILWLGCSDSRVPETTILGLQPGDVFVHRNIANLVSPTDINTAAVVEYAVANLRVQHVVLCGHSCCGGAAAALAVDGSTPIGSVLDIWLSPLKALRREHAEELATFKDANARATRLAELNVAAGVQVLLGNHVVNQAIRDRGLQVHGVLYDIASGLIRDLAVDHSKKTAPNGFKDDKTAVVHEKHGVLLFKDEGVAMAVQ